MSDPKTKILNDVIVKGNLFEKEDMVVSGQVDGNINAQNLEINQTSKIKGNIKTTKTRINGSVVGDITSEYTHLSRSADVKGKLSQKFLSIDEGAKIDIKTKTSN